MGADSTSRVRPHCWFHAPSQPVSQVSVCSSALQAWSSERSIRLLPRHRPLKPTAQQGLWGGGMCRTVAAAVATGIGGRRQCCLEHASPAALSHWHSGFYLGLDGGGRVPCTILVLVFPSARHLQDSGCALDSCSFASALPASVGQDTRQCRWVGQQDCVRVTGGRITHRALSLQPNPTPLCRMARVVAAVACDAAVAWCLFGGRAVVDHP